MSRGAPATPPTGTQCDLLRTVLHKLDAPFDVFTSPNCCGWSGIVCHKDGTIHTVCVPRSGLGAARLLTLCWLQWAAHGLVPPTQQPARGPYSA